MGAIYGSGAIVTDESLEAGAPRADDALVYICNPEWCDADDSVHDNPPFPFLAWRIDPKGGIEEYAAHEDNWFCIPASEADVRPVIGWRMPCGSWTVVEPLHTTWAEARRYLSVH